MCGGEVGDAGEDGECWGDKSGDAGGNAREGMEDGSGRDGREAESGLGDHACGVDASCGCIGGGADASSFI